MLIGYPRLAIWPRILMFHSPLSIVIQFLLNNSLKYSHFHFWPSLGKSKPPFPQLLALGHICSLICLCFPGMAVLGSSGTFQGLQTFSQSAASLVQISHSERAKEKGKDASVFKQLVVFWSSCLTNKDLERELVPSVGKRKQGQSSVWLLAFLHIHFIFHFPFIMKGVSTERAAPAAMAALEWNVLLPQWTPVYLKWSRKEETAWTRILQYQQ